MSREVAANKRTRVVAGALWVAFFTTLVGAAYLGVNRPEDPITIIDAIWAFSFIGFPTTGFLIVRRLPSRPLGWNFLVAPLLLILGVFFSEVAEVAIASNPRSAPWYAWGSNVTFSTGLVLFVFVPLLLPAGTVPSRGLRIVAGVAAIAGAVWIASALFAPGPLSEFRGGVENPLGIAALGDFFDLANAIVGPVILMIPMIGIVSLILRARRSDGIERQQMKWIAFGAATIFGAVASLWIVERLFGDLSDAAATLFIIVVILAFPVTIGVAMLRYRLFDIDVVINRTLVYAALTAALLGSYLVLVVTLGRVLDPVTRDSDVAVAASTLAVAALFRPLRARLQAFIDRRFYRRKFDARATLDEFSAHLRDEVDLGSLSHRLVSVAGGTMQAAHVSLWLTSPAQRLGRRP